MSNQLAYGWSAETLHEQFPHLSLAQIHAALAYFYDHQEEFEREIREQEREVAAWQAELGESPLQRRLRQFARFVGAVHVSRRRSAWGWRGRSPDRGSSPYGTRR